MFPIKLNKATKISNFVEKLIPLIPSPLQQIIDIDTESAGIKLFLKREDLIHDYVSGNKWRKLKYNLLEAQSLKFGTLLTFGGAYSNHLFATAVAGKSMGFKTIGIIRGDELEQKQLSPTLSFCKEQGMSLHFVSRSEYKQRNDPEYLGHLKASFNNPYLIPEGGSSDLALKGVAEMTWEVEKQLGVKPSWYATAVGTGGTAAGILSSGNKVLGFSALKGGDFLQDDIAQLLGADPSNLKLFTPYHFGGYGKWNQELLGFMQQFWNQHAVQLDQVYTGKMMFGLYDLIKSSFFEKGDTVVAVHTGGLQGLTPEARFI